MGRKRHPEPLTPAEQRVLEEVRTGATNAEIAVRLGLSINTVKYHVANMLAKTGLDDRAALARWEMPREPGPGTKWAVRAAVIAGAVAVVAAGLLVLASFYQSAPASQAWMAYAPRVSSSSNGHLVVLELTSGTRRDLRAAEGWSIYDPVWSPTGDHLLAREENLSSGASRMVVFAREGWTRRFVDGDFAQAAWAPNGSVAVAIGLDQVTLLRPDGSVVASQANYGAVLSVSSRAWSPDSQSFVAFRSSAELLIGSTAGEFWRVDDELRAIGVGSAHRVLPVGWTTDSSALVLSASAPPPNPTLMLRVELSTRSVAILPDEEVRLALANRQLQVSIAAGQDPRWAAAVAQLWADHPDAAPRLLGETADGRGLVFATGNVDQPDQLIIAHGEGQLRIADALEAFDETRFSIVLTGDWPIPAGPTPP